MKSLPQKLIIFMLYPVFLFVFSLGMFGVGIYFKLNPGYSNMYLGMSKTFLIVGLIALVLTIILLIPLLLKIKKYFRITLPLYLYETCKNNGFTDLTSPANVERAKVYASQLGIKSQDIQSVFDLGEQIWQDANLKEEEKEIARLKKAEIFEVKQSEKYAKLSGRNKRIQMHLDSAREYEAKLNGIRQGIGSAINATQEKEINWAARGGAVSAIAGGAAGVAAAVDAQMKNAEIRSRNEANKQLMYRAFAGHQEDINFYRKLAKFDYEAAEAAKTKLVDENSDIDYLSLIEFSNLKSEFSKTGALHISVQAKKKDKIVIFDSVEAVIDGSIYAEVYQNKICVGKALLILPEDGLAGGVLKGICLDKIDSNKPYDIKFISNKLWTIEK